MRRLGLVRWGIYPISTGTPLGSYIPTNYAVATVFREAFKSTSNLYIFEVLPGLDK